MKIIIGVPGAGKTTYLASALKEYSIKDYIFTSLTNTAIRSFLIKAELETKKNSIRTIYGLAYKELARQNKLDDWKTGFFKNEKHLEYIKDKLKKYSLPNRLLDDIQNLITEIVLLSLKNNVNYQQVLDELKDRLKIEYNKKFANIYSLLYDLFKDYENKKFYTFIFLISEAIENNFDFFNVYDKYNDVLNHDPYIFIDEFQDVSIVIYDYIDKLKKTKKLTLLGDPAQEIFTYLVTDSKKVMKRANKIKYFSSTHRFGKEISDLANKLLKMMNYNYRIKENNNKNSKVIIKYYNTETLTEILGKSLSHNKKVALLVRTKEQLKRYEKIIKDARYPYINLEKYDLSILEEMKNRVEKQLKEERKKISFYLKQNLAEDVLKTVYPSYREIIKYLIFDSPVIFLSTVHTAKGLDFDNVVFIDEIPKKIRKLNSYDLYSMKEELKVLYTAVTRAKENLYILKTFGGYLDYFDINY